MAVVNVSKPPSQQRKNERFEKRLPVTLIAAAGPATDGTGRELTGTTRNISLGGVFVETDSELSFDTRVEIRLSLPTQREPLKAMGRVRWVEKASGKVSGLGIQFEGLSPKDVYALNKVLI